MTVKRSSDETYDRDSNRGWMPLWLRVLWGIGILLVVFLAGMATGMLVERNRYEDKIVLNESWQELGDVIAFLEDDSYYRPDEQNALDRWRSDLERQAIDGLLQASGDNYAAYLPPAEARQSSERLTGKYEGVGVSIGESNQGTVEVVSVRVDSPASRADVRVGDTVEVVESTPIPQGNVDLAASLLRGDAGTNVSVRFGREGDENYTVTLERERISTGVKTVGYQYFPERDIAVIQISLFASTTTDELDDALQLAEADGAQRLVLDLRGNPGGWVSAAQEAIGRFVDPGAGPALLEDTWPAGEGMVEIPIEGGELPVYRGELIVLVDENTASAAEIVASALQYYDRGTIVGDTTFGKGSVQRVYEFPTEESLRLTVAEWFTPDKTPLQDVGVKPDVPVDTQAGITELLDALDAVFEGNPPEPSEGTPTPHLATPAA